MKQPKQQPRFSFYDDYDKNTFWLHLSDLSKIIKLFKMARHMITRGDEQYICHAIQSNRARMHHDHRIRTIAGKYIMASLHKGNLGVASFDSWLTLQENGRFNCQGRQARLKWLGEQIVRFKQIIEENK